MKPSNNHQAPQRIQKVLADCGLGSRREIESWIEMGRIDVNGQMAELGQKISNRDRVTVDGRPVRFKIKSQTMPSVLIYNKPEGVICSRSDPEGRPTVFDKLVKIPNQRWVMVGRLDFNTQGLLLFTNNGELAKRLMHPRYQVEREYAVRILGELSDSAIKQLRKGVMLDGKLAKFEKIYFQGGDGANRWYHVILKEGRNREVRRLFESQDLPVTRLIRVRYGNIHLPKGLKRGLSRPLDTKQVIQLMKSVQLDHKQT